MSAGSGSGSESASAFWMPDGDAFRATVATRGPWSIDHQHGGPSAALLARAIELEAAKWSTAFRVARITVSFHRPIAIDVHRVAVENVREGKKVRVTRAAMSDVQGRVIVSAEAVLIRTADVGIREMTSERPRSPEECAPHQFAFWKGAEGYHTAMELRHLSGTFGTGKMALWARMRVPLVPGETPSSLCRVVIAADSGNGVSVTADVANYTFLNPDLTVNLAREARGEWILLDATSQLGGDGIGLADTALSDAEGPFGRGQQSLVIERRN